MSDRPVYVLRLRPEPGVVDPMKALGMAIKVLSRRFGLRCTALRCEPPMLDQSLQGDVANVVAHNE